MRTLDFGLDDKSKLVNKIRGKESVLKDVITVRENDFLKNQ